MRKLIFIFFLLLLAIGFSYVIRSDPGYVMVSYHHWIVATSLWVSVATVLLAFFVLYFLIRSFKNIADIPAVLSRRRTYRRAQHYQKYMEKGIGALIIGEYKIAEKFFLKLTDLNDSYTHYLLVAKTANQLRDYKKRDAYLEKAFALGDEHHFEIALAQAQWYLQSDQLDEALVILKKYYQQAPTNSIILTSLKNIYLKTHDAQSLNTLLPQLKKQKLISSDEMKMLVRV